MKLTLTTEKLTHFAMALFVAYAVLLLPTEALAGPAALGDTLCLVVDWFQGPIGGGIATLAIIVIGIGALMGKVSWGMAIIVGLGVGIVFGATSIVEALGGTGC